ncbi:hypothetical protein GOB94_03515 [Granulicella sp. 5B5]|uniref:hypothetical protein n=1 Tax=Granulicella sp. 5B5 TaxID=1617967 RepID=UPI0015F70248|nr:hypothetical protein [Granulicella sp. 5B5]QMV17865.1 hypothetical protein GOB94_03515 [Granulicella sp. 5B5]
MDHGASVDIPSKESGSEIGLEGDSRYELVQRILATPDFIRSPQLSKFLLYICTASLQGGGQNLSEQHIGVEVFGREPDFDSAADTIVRSHALRLRKRLEQYFQHAGREEPVHLIVPRGSYAPLFVPAPDRSRSERQADAPTTEPSYPESMEAAGEQSTSLPSGFAGYHPEDWGPPSGHPAEPAYPVPIFAAEVPTVESPTAALARHLSFVVWRYRVLSGFLAVLFVGLAIAFGLHLRTHFRAERRHLLWGRLFTEDQPTRIVLGDSGLVLFHAVARRHVSLHEYLNNDYSQQLPYLEWNHQPVDPKLADFLLHRRYTSMADAMTLAHLLRLPEAIPERTLVNYSRDMHVEDFYSSNLIIIGAQEAVPWLDLFENHMDFVFSLEGPEKHSAFLNRRPHAGEKTDYNSYTPETASKVYGVIAFLPNLRGTGNVLILEGLSMVGTEAAIDLAIDDTKLLPILKTIRRPDGSLPHFEMLIESDVLGEGSGPAHVVAIHLHD